MAIQRVAIKPFVEIGARSQDHIGLVIVLSIFSNRVWPVHLFPELVYPRALPRFSVRNKQKCESLVTVVLFGTKSGR